MKKKQVTAVALAVVMAAGSMLIGCDSSKNSGPAAQQSGREQAGAPGQSGKNQPGSSQSGEGNGEQTTVTFRAAAMTEEHQGFLDWFAGYVTEVYPSTRADMLGVSDDLNDYRQKLDVVIQAGTASDIADDFRPELVLNEYYENLNPYFENQEDRDRINEALIKPNKAYDPTGEGLYALPYNSRTWNTWVRLDWLEEVGVDVPINWNDFSITVEEITDVSNDKYDLCIRGGTGSTNILEMSMCAYSGLDHYFTEDGKSTINDPKNAEFVQKYLADCYNVYTAQDDLTKGWANLADSSQPGKAGIVTYSLGSVASMVQAFEEDYNKFQAARSPARDGGYVVHAGLMPLGLSMNSQSQNEETVWKVISLHLNREVNTKYYQLYGEVPANMEAAQDPFFKDPSYMSVGVDIETSADVRLSNTPYYLPTYLNIQSDMEFNIQAVMSREMTPQELLNTQAVALEEAYVDYNESVKQ